MKPGIGERELVSEGKEEGKNLAAAKRKREYHDLVVVEETKRLSVVNLRQMLDIRGWRTCAVACVRGKVPEG